MSAGTEERLLDALDAMAEQVEFAPDAHERAQAEWRWRARRRRILTVVIAVVIVAVADVAGLWALNRAKVA
jgi:acyl-coenzyme A thioesterase PaaI-like protein